MFPFPFPFSFSFSFSVGDETKLKGHCVRRKHCARDPEFSTLESPAVGLTSRLGTGAKARDDAEPIPTSMKGEIFGGNGVACFDTVGA